MQVMVTQVLILFQMIKLVQQSLRSWQSIPGRRTFRSRMYISSTMVSPCLLQTMLRYSSRVFFTIFIQLSQSIAQSQFKQLQMAQDETAKKKKAPPTEILPNKQILPMIGFGTYSLTDPKQILDILKGAFLAGYRHIDTARFYDNQTALGSAIQTCIKEGRCKREELFIATKTFNHVDKNPLTELKDSLNRLNLKYVDLYYLHAPAGGLDGEGKWTHRQICDIWKDMEECVRKGYARHLGISNFNGQSVLDLLTYCKIKPIVNQFQFHLYLQQNNLVEICQKNGIHCIAYCPLGHPGAKQECNILKDELVLQLASKYGKTPGQIALKFVLSRGVGIIPKTKTIQRLKENFDSWNIELAQQDIKKLKALHKSLRIVDFKSFFPQQVDLFD